MLDIKDKNQQLTGYVHSIETFGSVDGPGIRFVIFLRGCRMRCRYCHNVDTWETGESWAQRVGTAQAAEDIRTAEELLDQAERFRPYWGEDGGITVSGGEPLLQIDFLTALFEEAKVRGIHTCLDSALQPFTREEPFFSEFERLMESTDLVLADIKHIDPEKHRDLTGRENENILDGIRYLSEIGKPVWIRHVLVPGFTDDEAALKRTRAFIDTLTNVEKVEVLPYHAMGVYKWEQLGIPYTLSDVEPPAQESVSRAREILGAV